RNSRDVAERAAAAGEVSLTPIERYDLNFITGVLNTMQERDITEVIIGLHRRTALIDSFLGDKIERLLRSTNRMICITRCFNPLSTLSKVYVAVPKKAEFETGFTRWVQAVGNLCRHIGCPVEFWCEDETMRMIRAVLLRARIGIAVSHKRVESFDDFVLRQGSVGQDDLLVVVSARRTSVSFDSDMDEVPPYLQRYYQSGNLIMIYPGQFGTETTTSLAETETMTMAETMATDMTTAPSPIYLKLKNLLRRLRKP
ncbi:MAG: cation:proton antiporter, partial [Duncaniella sp.]|nr:cation:proton antiporter [Duncaniella sp.]